MRSVLQANGTAERELHGPFTDKLAVWRSAERELHGPSTDKLAVWRSAVASPADSAGDAASLLASLQVLPEFQDYLQRKHGGALPDKVGFVEGLTGDLRRSVPFVGTAAQIHDLNSILRAAARIGDGRGRRSDYDVVFDMIVAQERGQSWGGIVGGLVAELPAFMGEILVGGGIVGAGLRVGAKQAAKTALGKAAQDLVARGVAKSAAARAAATAGSLVGGAVAAAELNEAIASTFGPGGRMELSALQRGFPALEFVRDEGRALSIALSDREPTYTDQRWAGRLDVWIEYLSERMGGLFARTLGLPALKAAAANRIAAKLGLDLEKRAKLPAARYHRFTTKLAEKTWWHGPAEEILEERFGDFLRAGIGGLADMEEAGDFAAVWPGLEQLSAEAVAFMIPGAARIAGNRLALRLEAGEQLTDAQNAAVKAAGIPQDGKPITPDQETGLAEFRAEGPGSPQDAAAASPKPRLTVGPEEAAQARRRGLEAIAARVGVDPASLTVRQAQEGPESEVAAWARQRGLEVGFIENLPESADVRGALPGEGVALVRAGLADPISALLHEAVHDIQAKFPAVHDLLYRMAGQIDSRRMAEVERMYQATLGQPMGRALRETEGLANMAETVAPWIWWAQASKANREALIDLVANDQTLLVAVLDVLKRLSNALLGSQFLTAQQQRLQVLSKAVGQETDITGAQFAALFSEAFSEVADRVQGLVPSMRPAVLSDAGPTADQQAREASQAQPAVEKEPASQEEVAPIYGDMPYHVLNRLARETGVAVPDRSRQTLIRALEQRFRQSQAERAVLSRQRREREERQLREAEQQRVDEARDTLERLVVGPQREQRAAGAPAADRPMRRPPTRAEQAVEAVEEGQDSPRSERRRKGRPGAEEVRFALEPPRAFLEPVPAALEARAMRYERNYGFTPYIRERVQALELGPSGRAYYPGDTVPFALKTSGDYGQDERTGLWLNMNGTVTVYYPTTEAHARQSARDKRVQMPPGAQRAWLTNESDSRLVMADPGPIEQEQDVSQLLMEVSPHHLQIVREHEDGRKDFFLPLREGQSFLERPRRLQWMSAIIPRDRVISPDAVLEDITDAAHAAMREILEATPQQLAKMRAAAKKTLIAKHNIENLLTENGKLRKTRANELNLKLEGKGVASLGFGMAEAQKLNGRSWRSCIRDAMCRDSCLGHSSGGNLLYGGEGALRSAPRLQQFLRTEAFLISTREIIIKLHQEIEAFHKRATTGRGLKVREENKKKGITAEYELMYPSIRLNVTSDFPPSIFKPLYDAFLGRVMFYDYTKNFGAVPVSNNHHLTYSSTGAAQIVDGVPVASRHHQWDRQVQLLLSGRNLAMAFSAAKHMPRFVKDEKTGHVFEVVNADEYDARFLDPKREDGVGIIAGLKNKDRRPKSKLRELSAETGRLGADGQPTDHPSIVSAGFFFDYDPARDGDTLLVRNQSEIMVTARASEYGVLFALARPYLREARIFRNGLSEMQPKRTEQQLRHVEAQLHAIDKADRDQDFQRADELEERLERYLERTDPLLASESPPPPPGGQDLPPRWATPLAIKRLRIPKEGNLFRSAGIPAPTSMDALYRYWINSWWPVEKVAKQLGADDLNRLALLRRGRTGQRLRRIAVASRAIMREATQANIPAEFVADWLYADHAPERNRAMATINWTQEMIDAERARISAALRDARAIVSDAAANVERVQGNLRGTLPRTPERDTYAAELQQAKRRLAMAKDTQRRFEALRERIKATAPFRGTEEQRQALSGMSNEEAARIISEADSKGWTAALARIRDIKNALRNQVLDGMVADGLLPAEDAAAYRSKYRSYMPLRTYDAAEMTMGTGRGLDVRGREVQRALGRISKADNPLAFFFLQAEVAAVRGEKNIVQQRLLEMVEANPDPSVWVAHPAATKREIDPATGLVVEVEDKALVRADNVVAVKREGKTMHILFQPEYIGMAEAINGSSAEHGNAILQHLAQWTRWFAAMTTRWNPFFAPVNLVRDLGQGTLTATAEEGLAVGAEILRGAPAAFAAMLHVASHPESEAQAGMSETLRYAYEYRDSGGPIAFLALDGYEEKARTMHREILEGESRGARAAIARFLEATAALNDATENTTRLAYYIALRRRGVDVATAAAKAKDLTTNFERGGDVRPWFNGLYAFANAGLQGSDRVVRAFRHRAMWNLMGLAIGASAALAYYNVVVGGDDEDGVPFYWKVPDYVKADAQVIMLPDGRYLTIPLPWVYRWITNIGRQLAEVALGGKSIVEATVSQFAEAFSEFSPVGGEGDPVAALTPTLLRPVLESVRNEDWTGRAIRPTRFPGDMRPTSEIHWPNPSPLMKQVARAINAATGGDQVTPGRASISPDSLEHLVKGYLPGLGAETRRIMATLEKLGTGTPVRPSDIPLLRRFYRAHAPERWDRQFREQSEAVRRAAARIELAKDSGDEDALMRARALHGRLARLDARRRATDSELRNLRKRRNALAPATAQHEELTSRIQRLQLRFSLLYQKALAPPLAAERRLGQEGP